MNRWRKRIIPVLLLHGEGLVKTINFKSPKYIGDAVNSVKIFNDKEVDELALIDITPLDSRSVPNFKLLKEISSECFCPLSYGGKVRSIEQIRKILGIGVEKVIINSAAIEDPDFLISACMKFGSSTIVGSIDFRRDIFGRQRVYTSNGRKNTDKTPMEVITLFEKCGVGEILLNSIDRDGTRKGFDLETINTLSNSVKVPVIACGGANSVDDFILALKNGASAVAAGTKFVFTGKHNAVLITYLSDDENKKLLKYEYQ
ncbi:MAG: imidazole glycerol phosphate synthase subunit HisF [Candidatus Staskawiczbacteria bacterium]|nr:imidazole glycerol phosphate synthase subunit HisF [Candidatus Staskawiczbacteria bacterium]